MSRHDFHRSVTLTTTLYHQTESCLKRPVMGVMLALLVMVPTLLQPAASRAQGTEQQPLAGSWMITVNATSGGEDFSFKSLATFTADGSYVGTTQGDTILNASPGALPITSPQHGTWTSLGNATYALTFMAILTDLQGNFGATLKVRQTINLNQTGDTWSGPFRAEYFDANGNVIFTFSGTMQATRINVEPLG